MNYRKLMETIPIAPLKIISMNGCKPLSQAVEDYLITLRHGAAASGNSYACHGYESSRYLTECATSRFGTGEGKAEIKESLRGTDLYILADVMNHNQSYTLFTLQHNVSSDDLFQDLKRIIAACSTSKPKRINIILPFLYESKQHRREKPESMFCAYSLQELASMGIENIITFDAHDPSVQNSIPIRGFDNFYTSFQFIQSLIETEPDVKIDKEHLMVISPYEGSMELSIYYANILSVEVGMFYKRRNYSTFVDGRNPIVAREFIGADVRGKTVLIIDDIIWTGESILEVAANMKKRGADKIFLIATFGIFCSGFDLFDQYYESGIINRIFTTNLIYTSEELLRKPYYVNVDLSKYIAVIIDTLNHDTSVNDIISPVARIHELLAEHSKKQYNT